MSSYGYSTPEPVSEATYEATSPIITTPSVGAVDDGSHNSMIHPSALPSSVSKSAANTNPPPMTTYDTDDTVDYIDDTVDYIDDADTHPDIVYGTVNDGSYNSTIHIPTIPSSVSKSTTNTNPPLMSTDDTTEDIDTLVLIERITNTSAQTTLDLRKRKLGSLPELDVSYG